MVFFQITSIRVEVMYRFLSIAAGALPPKGTAVAGYVRLAMHLPSEPIQHGSGKHVTAQPLSLSINSYKFHKYL